MIGISNMIQSAFGCISQIAKYGQARIENQETTELISDKKDLEKAGNISEQIIHIALKYKSSMSKRDKRKLNSLVKRFNKVD